MREIFERRSIRCFLPQPVPKTDVLRLLEAAMHAPSAGNQQPWEFIVLENPERLEALSGVSPYATPLVDAPLGIVVLLNDANLRFPECWQQDLSACTQNILLEAEHLGLGAVWLAIADFKERMDAAKKFFDLPKHISVFAVVAVGYPAEKKAAVNRYQESRVHYGAYGRAK